MAILHVHNVCPKCGGRGEWHLPVEPGQNPHDTEEVTCDMCNGLGEVGEL